MCLATNNVECKIANEDIKVFKLLRRVNGIFRAPYRGVEYVLGRLYESKFGIYISKGHPDYVEVTAYSDNRELFYTVKSLMFFSLDLNCMEVEEGLHSCKTFEEAKKVQEYFLIHHTNVDIFEAIIPAGSAYFENEKEYVSSQLIVTKEYEQVPA